MCASYQVPGWAYMMCGSLAKITLPFLVFSAPITQLLLPIKAGTGEASSKLATDLEISLYSLYFP